MGRKGFKDLLVWQKAKDLAVKVYQVSDRADLKKDFSLRDQMRRSAVSVASNLAEGDERAQTERPFVSFTSRKAQSRNCVRNSKSLARLVTWSNLYMMALKPSVCN